MITRILNAISPARRRHRRAYLPRLGTYVRRDALTTPRPIR
jgi:hypothetical protein